MKWICSFFMAVCLFVIPCLSWGATDVFAWQNLSTLRAGQRIQVIDKDHGKHNGAFLSFDDQSIKLHESTGDAAVSRENVARVRTSAHRIRHAVVGLAVGAGAGAVIGAMGGGCSAGNDCIGLTRGQTSGLSAAIGAVIGAIVGAVLPAHKTIYRASL